MRTTLFVLLSSSLLVAADPPRNQVPHVPTELDRLRAASKDQQLRIAELKSQAERLDRDFERLKSAQEKSQEYAAQLQADLARERSQIEALRGQVAALEREVYRPKGNKKELVGSWKVVSVMEDGERRAQAVARLVFGASSLTFQYQEPGRERVYTYKVDPDEQPKEIDVFGGGVRPTLGIYQLQDDRLTLCIDHRLTNRPTEFLSRPEPGTALWIMEREGRTPRGGTTSQTADTRPPVPR